MKCFKAQTELMLKRKSFIITLTGMILLSVAAFAANCLFFYGDYIINIRSAKYLTITSDLQLFSIIPTIFSLIFPLIPILPFADSYFEEREKMTVDFCLTRCSCKEYYFSKLAAVFISGAAVIGIPLIINYLLNFIAFPLDSVITSQGFAIPNCQIYFSEALDTIIFKDLFCKNMYIYNLIFILINSLFAGLSAVIIYQISFFYTQSRTILTLIYFAAYHLGTLVLSSFSGDSVSIGNYILSSHFLSNQTVFGLLIVLIILLLSAFAPTAFALKKLNDLN